MFKNLLLVTTCIAGLSTAASAATFNFVNYADGTDFTNTDGDVRTGGEADWATIVGGVGTGILDVGSGISVVGSGSTSTGVLTHAYFDSGSAGLGVCTVLTNNGQCNPGNDDNVGAIGGSSSAGDGTFESLILTFNQIVNMTDIIFAAEGHGAFTGDILINGALTSITGGTLNTSLIGSIFDFQYVPVPAGTADNSTNEFYIEAATVSEVPGLVSTVPVPAALPLLLAGLGGLGMVRRRRTKKAA